MVAKTLPKRLKLLSVILVLLVTAQVFLTLNTLLSYQLDRRAFKHDLEVKLPLWHGCCISQALFFYPFNIAHWLFVE